MQVVLVPLGLVSTQVPLISCSTHSAKLPFQKAAAVVKFKTTRTEGGGVCTRRTEYSSKRPLPTLGLCKKGGGEYFWELTVITSMNQT